MNSHKHIQNELRRHNSGLPFNNNQPFSVPEGYFEGLSASVLAKVKSSISPVQTELGELSPLLAGIPKITPYSVPFFYFEQNTEIIPDFSKEPDIHFLKEAGKTLPYTLPQNYFITLSERISTKVERPKAKLLPLFAGKWMRIAAAAVVGGILFLAGYEYFNDKSHAPVANYPIETNKTLVAHNSPTIEQEIKKASTKDLEEFIKNIPVAKERKVETTSADKETVKELLKDVSDAEMETFLAATPTADDDLFVTD